MLTVQDARDYITLLQAFVDIKTNDGGRAAEIVAKALNESGEDTVVTARDIEVVNAVLDEEDKQIIVYTKIEGCGDSGDEVLTATVYLSATGSKGELHGKF